jgi:hypothetical protein
VADDAPKLRHDAKGVDDEPADAVRMTHQRAGARALVAERTK